MLVCGITKHAFCVWVLAVYIPEDNWGHDIMSSMCGGGSPVVGMHASDSDILLKSVKGVVKLSLKLVADPEILSNDLTSKSTMVTCG